MSRDSNGTYSLPVGNPVVSGDTITSSWANTTMDDLGDEVTNSLDRTGKGGMTGQFKAASGAVGTPGVSFSAETTSGLYRAASNDFRFSVGGNDIFRYNASGVQVYLSAAWHTVWHAGNDGTGSGLDADTLDGQEGTYYAVAAALNASALTSGTVPTARLGSGVADATTYLRGDQTWQVVAAGVTAINDLSDVTITAAANLEVLAFNGSAWVDTALSTSHIQSGTFDNARIAASNVTQHQASLTIAESQITDGSVLARVAANETISGNYNFTGTPTYNSVEIGFRVIPRTTDTTVNTAKRGYCMAISAGITIPASTFAAGDAFMIYNNSGSPITITRGASLAMYVGGVDSATFSLPARSRISVWFNSATEAILG